MSIKFIGDVHLGRKFVHNVPLHRRGEREEGQFIQFEQELNEVEGYDTCVQVGDIFDKAIVGFDVIMRTVDLIRRAAEHHQGVDYFFLRGNHDASKDLTRVSAFDILSALLHGIGNVWVLHEPGVHNGIGFAPWSPTIPAADLVGFFKDLPLVVGHWDLDGFGNDFNVVPTKVLSKNNCMRVVTGHVHVPEFFERDGVEVTVVGSMQPYSHGEDPERKIYVTVSVDDLLEGDYTDKCVRVDLKPDESLENMDINCLQLTVRRVKEDGSEDLGEVSLGEFNFQELFDQQMADDSVRPDIMKMIWEKYNAHEA